MLNLYYTHSPITDYLAFEHSSISEDPSLFISARSFRSRVPSVWHVNKDGFRSLHHLLAFSIDFNELVKKYLAQTGRRGIRLFIPHLALQNLVLMATHESILEVNLIEEGDACYLRGYDSPRREGSGGASQLPNIENLSEFMEPLGFLRNKLNDVFCCNLDAMFYNFHNMTREALCSSNECFRGFDGKKTILELRSQGRLPAGYCILILPDPRDLDFFPGYLSKVGAYINSVGPANLVYKTHPAFTIDFYPENLRILLNNSLNWATSDITSSFYYADPALLECNEIAIVGHSSAIRYAIRLNRKYRIFD